MRVSKKLLCCSIALWVAPPWFPTAIAQSASERMTGIDEIVVTARRRDEGLQDVPASINVVTARAIDDLKLTEFTDLEAVVPGLTLAQDGSGTQSSTSLRGVSFDARSTAPPTVAMYLNDAPVQSLFLYDSLFDIGQIEVLRGPQGTLRGISAPSGAITVTTRKPDTGDIGGFFKGLLTDRDGRNFQAGVNVPLVPDRLAVRLSGVSDRTQANGVKSLRNSSNPRQATVAGRFSVLFEPSDDLSLEASYTHIDKKLRSFEQVTGPGQGSSLQPPISAGQRRAVQDARSDVEVELDVLTVRMDKDFDRHSLTYVGSWQEADTSEWTDNDKGGILPGAAIPFSNTSAKEEVTHEIRFSSVSDGERRFDYTFGVFYDDADTSAAVINPGPLLPGAFGSPAGPPDFDAFDPRYQMPVLVDIDYLSRETSAFASLTWHATENTELTVGLRQIWSRFNSSQGTRLDGGIAPVPPAMMALPDCALAQLESTYPGFCDVPVDGMLLPDSRFRAKEKPLIYNVSLAHHLNDNLMLYAATGTAYRPPIASPGLQGDLAGHPDPSLNSLTYHPKEMSTNYELGFRWTGLDGRARLNATAFYQTFDDLTLQVPYVYYYNTATFQPSMADFTASVDAKVSGVELDAAISFGRLILSGQVSYANGDVDGSDVPCNTYSGGMPAFNTAGLISLCPGGSASLEPLWSATFQGEYSLPVTDGMDAYARLLVSYRGDNRHRPGLTVDQYVITNLYVGLRSLEGSWEVSGFVRNLFDTRRMLDRAPVAYDLNSSLGQSFPELIPMGGSGYYRTQVTPPREVGISVHYAWGSR